MAKTLPKWASDLIHELRAAEIKLGNLPAEAGWHQRTVDDLMSEEESGALATKTEAMFARICLGLKSDGFAAREIADAVNAVIASGRLPYCSETEVAAVLG